MFIFLPSNNVGEEPAFEANEEGFVCLFFCQQACKENRTAKGASALFGYRGKYHNLPGTEYEQ